jgi:hypothetical protein
MNPLREIAYRVDPALWTRDVLGIMPHAWQEKFLLAERGASIVALTARQVGKTTAAACGMAHSAIFMPGSLSVVACPTQNQSAEALRKVRDMVLKAGAELTTENIYKLELANGSRVWALPGTEESIRGLTVDAWIVADEAARLDPAIMAALHPMRTQRPNARFAMLSTAWSRTDPFWTVWASDDPSWTHIQATVDVEPNLIAPDALERAKRQLSEDDFKREYLGIPAGSQVSPFIFDLYERATQTPVHRNTWEYFRPHIIAHDVGRTKDRSTAVIGGKSPFAPDLFGIKEFKELPQGLYGSARADTLAMIDRRYDSKTLIVADLSNDATYAEPLFERFGHRLIGVQITRGGNDMNPETRQVKNDAILVYTIGRTFLFDLLLREMQDDKVRILHGAASIRAYEQLMALEIEFRQSGMIYGCPSGQHDDLAISCAMLIWAAQHPHLEYWTRALEGPRPPRNRRPAPSAAGWT